MLNRIDIQGRITHDLELRHTGGGTPVCTFSIAVDRDYVSQDGKREADFISCTIWRVGAEFLCRNFGKGQMILVTGRLQTRSYTDKEGAKRTSTEVLADNVYFAGSKQTRTEPEEDDETEGELPF